jgi:hypothetical protein
VDVELHLHKQRIVLNRFDKIQFEIWVSKFKSVEAVISRVEHKSVFLLLQ